THYSFTLLYFYFLSSSINYRDLHSFPTRRSSDLGVKVARDADGREVTSDIADGITTKSPEIPDEVLIQAGFCWDTASCDKFNYSAGCWGHHSWSVTFQRQY